MTKRHWLQLQHGNRKVCLTPKIITWQYNPSFTPTKLIQNPVCSRAFAWTHWCKAPFTFICVTVLDVLVGIILPVYVLSPHKVSILMKSELSLVQKGVTGGRGSCFVTTLGAMMQFTIKMQIERQGVTLHLVFTLLRCSQGRPVSAQDLCIQASKSIFIWSSKINWRFRLYKLWRYKPLLNWEKNLRCMDRHI